MRMQAAAGVILVGLGHEARRHPVLAREAADEELEEPRVIRRLQSVGLVHEVDLELAGAGLRDRGVGGNVHRLAGAVEPREKGVPRVQLAQCEDLGLVAPLARTRAGWHAQLAAAVVDEVELHLGRHHGRQPMRGVALDHPRERLPRVAVIGSPVLVEHPDRQERGGAFEPRHRKKPALGRQEHAIGIARAEHQGAVVDVLAPDVQIQDREGEARAFGQRLVGIAARDALAARLAVEIGGDGADRSDFGMLVEPAHRMTCGR
jgi:hypothetical protein